jgi:hypothetical protein
MRLRIAVVALATLGGVALTSTAASAMPNGIPNANEIAGQTSNIQQVRWVCGPWGNCVWRPGWGGAFAWGPAPVWGPPPAWGGAVAWGPAPVWRPGPVVWGPRPGWGWNAIWW